MPQLLTEEQREETKLLQEGFRLLESAINKPVQEKTLLEQISNEYLPKLREQLKGLPTPTEIDPEIKNPDAQLIQAFYAKMESVQEQVNQKITAAEKLNAEQKQQKENQIKDYKTGLDNFVHQLKSVKCNIENATKEKTVYRNASHAKDEINNFFEKYKDMCSEKFSSSLKEEFEKLTGIYISSKVTNKEFQDALHKYFEEIVAKTLFAFIKETIKKNITNFKNQSDHSTWKWEIDDLYKKSCEEIIKYLEENKEILNIQNNFCAALFERLQPASSLKTESEINKINNQSALQAALLNMLFEIKNSRLQALNINNKETDTMGKEKEIITGSRARASSINSKIEQISQLIKQIETLFEENEKKSCRTKIEIKITELRATIKSLSARNKKLFEEANEKLLKEANEKLQKFEKELNPNAITSTSETNTTDEESKNTLDNSRNPASWGKLKSDSSESETNAVNAENTGIKIETPSELNFLIEETTQLENFFQAQRELSKKITSSLETKNSEEFTKTIEQLEEIKNSINQRIIENKNSLNHPLEKTIEKINIENYAANTELYKEINDALTKSVNLKCNALNFLQTFKTNLQIAQELLEQKYESPSPSGEKQDNSSPQISDFDTPHSATAILAATAILGGVQGTGTDVSTTFLKGPVMPGTLQTPTLQREELIKMLTSATNFFKDVLQQTKDDAQKAELQRYLSSTVIPFFTPLPNDNALKKQYENAEKAITQFFSVYITDPIGGAKTEAVPLEHAVSATEASEDNLVQKWILTFKEIVLTKKQYSEWDDFTAAIRTLSQNTITELSAAENNITNDLQLKTFYSNSIMAIQALLTTITKKPPQIMMPKQKGNLNSILGGVRGSSTSSKPPIFVDEESLSQNSESSADDLCSGTPAPTSVAHPLSGGTPGEKATNKNKNKNNPTFTPLNPSSTNNFFPPAPAPAPTPAKETSPRPSSSKKSSLTHLLPPSPKIKRSPIMRLFDEKPVNPLAKISNEHVLFGIQFKPSDGNFNFDEAQQQLMQTKWVEQTPMDTGYTFRLSHLKNENIYRLELHQEDAISIQGEDDALYTKRLMGTMVRMVSTLVTASTELNFYGSHPAMVTAGILYATRLQGLGLTKLKISYSEQIGKKLIGEDGKLNTEENSYKIAANFVETLFQKNSKENVQGELFFQRALELHPKKELPSINARSPYSSIGQ